MRKNANVSGVRAMIATVLLAVVVMGVGGCEGDSEDKEGPAGAAPTVSEQGRALVGGWYDKESARAARGSVLLFREDGRFTAVALRDTVAEGMLLGVGSLAEGRWRMEEGELRLRTDGSEGRETAFRVIQLGCGILSLEDSLGKTSCFRALRRDEPLTGEIVSGGGLLGRAPDASGRPAPRNARR